MQDYTPSQYGEDFAHLDGASGYSLNLNDDLSSIHSGSTNLQQTPLHHQHQHGQQGGGDREDLEVLDFDQLSLNHSHPHSQLSQAQGLENGLGGEVANLYEEDFEGMLEDLNRELPPHACSYVPSLPYFVLFHSLALA